MTEKEFKAQKAHYRKQLVDSLFWIIPGIAIFSYAILNFIELTRDRYFFQSFNVPKLLSWFFDTFGPLPTTMLMLILSLLMLGYSIYRIVAYRKSMQTLTTSYEQASSSKEESTL